ncbi:MAG: carboxylating nicotinate-nucleotide diphosphorylase [Candidatus Obscuribacterales bacterium]|nr:carboxylating nicotinate-nucleotide diphosphorylase [Candidatus Obscuribacterales bacterium]
MLDRAIDLALDEDLGALAGINGAVDITTVSTVPSKARGRARVIVKEPTVLAGIDVLERVFNRLAARQAEPEQFSFEAFYEEGTYIKDCPTVVLSIEGPARAILTGERLALNLMQRMCGVATITRSFVEKVEGSGIKVLDTRKTTPCLRAFDRIAVHLGGGVNHRSGLYDRILIKDNHIAMAGSIKAAIEAARNSYPEASIEVETRSLEEVEQASALEPEHILLDNMSPKMVKEAIAIIDGRSLVEISGGINIATIATYVIEGVDAISVGALTHSAPAKDISLDMDLSL